MRKNEPWYRESYRVFVLSRGSGRDLLTTRALLLARASADDRGLRVTEQLAAGPYTMNKPAQNARASEKLRVGGIGR